MKIIPYEYLYFFKIFKNRLKFFSENNFHFFFIPCFSTATTNFAMYLNVRLGEPLPHRFKQLNKTIIARKFRINIRIYKHNGIRTSKNQHKGFFISIYITFY